MDDLKTAVDAVDIKKHPRIEPLKICISIQTKDVAAPKMVKKYLDGHAERNKGEDNRYARSGSPADNNQWCEHLIYRLCTQKFPSQAKIYKDHRQRIFGINKKGAVRVARRGL